MVVHTASGRMVPFILLSQLKRNQDFTLTHSILIRSFTDGTASSLSTTSPSPLTAQTVGIPSRPPLAKCSLSLIIAGHSLVLSLSRQFTRWLTTSSNCTSNCQLLEQWTYTLSHTRACSIWRL